MKDILTLTTKLVMVLWTVLFLYGCKTTEEQGEELSQHIQIEVSNNLNEQMQEVLVQVNPAVLSSLTPGENQTIVVSIDGQIIPSQIIGKESRAGLAFIMDNMDPNESKKIQLEVISTDSVPSYAKRTQAELSIKEGGEWQAREYIGGTFKNVDSLRVPDEHTDHSWYIRYEGPGWESDKVGYRFYLDWRNATDVFGKTTVEMVLQNVGQDGFDSYHELQDWGMDVLKVGESLGIGSPAVFTEGKAVRIDSTDSVISKVLMNGDIMSAVQTNYFGWKVAGTQLDVKSVYSIHAGSRLTRHQLSWDGTVENFATGIGKSDSVTIHTSRGDAESFGYIATFGKQSLNNDNLGLAVLFSSDQLREITEDDFSHIVTFDASNGAAEYYFLAAWEMETEGIKTEEEFLEYLQKKARELANPVTVAPVEKENAE